MSPPGWWQVPWQRLLAARRDDRLAHGLLLAGTPGLGQSELAQRLTALLLCEDETLDEACGRCRSCRLRSAQTHPDLLVVTLLPRDDGRLKTEIGVDQIRQLSQWFSLTAQLGRAQIAVIDPAERLNHAAANALLKTLEEPASRRYLLLVCAEPQRLPATVRSRCQRVELRLPDGAVARDWLLGRGHDGALVDQALLACDGHPGEALRLLDGNGLQRVEQMRSDLEALQQGRRGAAEIAKSWLADEPDERLRLLGRMLRRQAWRQRAGTAADGLTAPADFHKLAAWARRVDKTRGLLTVPLRHELLLAALLQQWKSLQH